MTEEQKTEDEDERLGRLAEQVIIARLRADWLASRQARKSAQSRRIRQRRGI